MQCCIIHQTSLGNTDQIGGLRLRSCIPYPTVGLVFDPLCCYALSQKYLKPYYPDIRNTCHAFMDCEEFLPSFTDVSCTRAIK